MKILAALILTSIYLFTFALAYLKQKDLLSPLCFFNAFMFITTVPRLLRMRTISYNNYPITEWSIFLYLVITIISVLITNFSISVFQKNNYRPTASVGNKAYQELPYKKTIAILLFIIGALSKIYLIYKSGGIAFIWNNINYRTFMLRGNGYINSLEIFITIGIALMLDCYYLSKSKKYLKMTIFMFCVGSILLLAFGARAPFLKSVLTLTFVKNYRSKQIRFSSLLNIKAIGISILCIFLIVMIPMIRSEDNRNLYKEPVKWIKAASDDIGKVVNEISSVDKDIFTYEYFYKNKKWNGTNYIDLLYAPIPSKIYSNKPPVDDGVYLANIMLGYKVQPPTPYKEILYQSSVPFSSRGIMFANFGIIGVVLGSVILGYIYGKVYLKTKKSNYNIYRIIVYQIVIVEFGLSNKQIVSVIVPVTLILIIKSLYYRKLKDFEEGVEENT